MRTIVIVSFIGLLFVVGCKTNMASREVGSPNASRKVLIAGENTAFKRKVVAKVIEDLGTGEWYFRIIGLDQLEEQNNGSYGAVLLLAGYRAGRLDRRVGSFLQHDATNPKAIVFCTRGTEEPMPDRSKPDLNVDSVSSASRDDRVDLRAKQLSALVVQRF